MAWCKVAQWNATEPLKPRKVIFFYLVRSSYLARTSYYLVLTFQCNSKQLSLGNGYSINLKLLSRCACFLRCWNSHLLFVFNYTRKALCVFPKILFRLVWCQLHNVEKPIPVQLHYNNEMLKHFGCPVQYVSNVMMPVLFSVNLFLEDSYLVPTR